MTCTCTIFEPRGQHGTAAGRAACWELLRAVEELRALADPGEGVTTLTCQHIALIDGSLILWGLAGQAHPDFVRKRRCWKTMFLPAMDRASGSWPAPGPLALASYISLPRSTEVVNALRLDDRPVPLRGRQLRHALPGMLTPRPAAVRRRLAGVLDRDDVRVRCWMKASAPTCSPARPPSWRGTTETTGSNFYYLNAGVGAGPG